MIIVINMSVNRFKLHRHFASLMKTFVVTSDERKGEKSASYEAV